MKKTIIAISAAAATLCALGLHWNARAEKGKEYAFNRAGELVRPTGYREWIYVGTPVTPNDLNSGKAAFPEFHNVYLAPSAWSE